MIRLYKQYLMGLLLCLIGISGHAQQLVDVSVSPPPSAYRALLVDVQRAFNEVTTTIRNRTNQQIDVKFQVVLKHSTSSFSIRSNQDVLPLTLSPNEFVQKTAEELVAQLSVSQFTVTLQDGQEKTLVEFYANNPETIIPDGRYELCVTTIPVNLNQQLIDIRTCNSVFLDFNAWVSPQLRSINNVPCPDTLQPFDPALTAWQLPISWDWMVPPGQVVNGNYKFTLYVVELLPNDTRDANQVLQALQDNPDASDIVVRKEFTGAIVGYWFQENLLPQHFAPRQGITAGLQLGYRYGVSVRVENQMGQQVDLPNKGFSPVCVFVYGRALVDDQSVAVVNPDNDFDAVIPDCACSTSATVATTQGEAYSQPLADETRIKMGYFRIKVNGNVLPTGGKYSGEGSIKISNNGLMGRVRVRFTNLEIRRINGLLTAVGGQAEAIEDAGFIPGEIRASFGDAVHVRIDYSTLPVVRDVFDGLQSASRFLDQLTSDEAISLPFGIATQVGDDPLRVGVFGMTFLPDRAHINLILQTPRMGDLQPLYFGAKQVCLSPKGLSADSTTFYLGSDLTIESNANYELAFKGTETSMTSSSVSNRSTSISLGCNWTFQRINLVGEVTLKYDFIRPVSRQIANSPATSADNQFVKATFGASFRNFQDVLLSANVTPFFFTADSSWTFSLSDVALDLSSSRNPETMVLTAAERPGNSAAEINTWTGLYAGNVSVGLPVALQSLSRHSLTAGFKGMKIGFNGGVSFTAYMANLLQLEGDSAGSLAGWQFSIDTLRMSMENNQFQPPALVGKLRFPLFDDPFSYRAYFPTVSATDPTRKLQIDVLVDERVSIRAAAFKSRFSLTAGSTIECSFTPKNYPNTTLKARLVANLNGNWTIEDPEKDVSFQALSFTGLKYDSDTGFDKSSFVVSLTSAVGNTANAAPQRNECGHKFNGFNVEISQIAPLFDGKFDAVGGARCGLQFAIDVMLVGGCNGQQTSNESWGFGAGTTLELTGKVSLTNGSPRIDSIQLALKAIRINVDVSVCHVSGSLEFIENDATYGNGFRGCVAFKLGVGLNVEGSVGAIFGKALRSDDPTQRYTYFSIDGYLGGLQLMLGQYLKITGFIGGLSLNMALRANNPNLPPIDAVVDRFASAGSCNSSSPLSAFPLVPREGAMQVMFGLTCADVAAGGWGFNGGMGMSASINTHGGVNSLAVGGFMDFIKPPQTAFLSVINDGMMLRGKLGLMYDIVNKKLTGTARVYINVANVLVGSASTVAIEGQPAASNEPFLAGKVALYLGADDWYIFNGNPWSPTNHGDPGGLLQSMPLYSEVSLMIPGIDVGLGSAGMYFAMGSYGLYGLPPLPPDKGNYFKIPPDIRAELNRTRGGRPDPSLTHGGIAFGGWIGGGFQTDWFLGFRAGVNVSAGFDAALLRYTGAASCVGSGGTFGINNFYGRGQAFAYADGSLQFNFNDNLYDIVRVNAMFIADFGGPNPSWIDGKIELTNSTIQNAAYGIFWGLGLAVDAVLDDENSDGTPAVTQFPFKAGTPCSPGAIDENRSAGTDPIIAQVMPGDSIESGQPIIVRLNKPIYQYFEWYNPRNQQVIRRRWLLKSYTLSRANGSAIPLTVTERLSENEYVFAPDANQRLIAGGLVRFKVRFVVQDKTGPGRDDWRDTEFYNEQIVSLTIRETDYHISAAEVLFSYPAAGQQFYLPNEGSNDERFVMLNHTHFEIRQLFADLHSSQYTVKNVVRIKDGETLIGEVSFEVRSMPNNRGALVFKLPQLPTSRALRLEFWKIATPRLIVQRAGLVNTVQGLGVNGQTVTGNSSPTLQEKAIRIYEYGFCTSKYSTFAEKIAATRVSPFRSNGDWSMTSIFSSDEGWDSIDIGPGNPLISDGRDWLQPAIEARVLINTPWYQQVRTLFQQKKAQLVNQSGSTSENLSRRVIIENSLQILGNDPALLPRVSFRTSNNRLIVGFEFNQYLREVAQEVGIELVDPPAENYTVRLTYSYPSLEYWVKVTDGINVYNKRDGLTATPLTINYEGYENAQQRLNQAIVTTQQTVSRAATTINRAATTVNTIR
ncbi:hypothetical protein [Spirosoma aerolatum]|uniref:hypothetical protein n=1 Tax=Spirosoma aerolatum TaxID=1211326 RepID=UPI0009ACA950|nr:hypothetical protein [Spirosoma aerolatum]